MAYIPGCRADVFISYAHRDNLDGWVTSLKNKLTEKLNPFLAGAAEVWSDDRIQPGACFKDEIQQKLKDTPIFVAVVSPAYLDSEFSMIDELEWFQNQGGKEVIQLLKVPLEEGQTVPLPETQYKILHSLGDGHVLDGEALNKVLDEVAAAINVKLREFWGIRPKIYVAQLRDDQWKPHWDVLKERLHADGYAIVPKGLLPLRAPDGRIRDWFEGVRLSIHLDSAQEELARRQLEIAKQIGSPSLILHEPPGRDQLPALVSEVQSRLEADRKPSVYLIYDHYSDHSRVASLPERIRIETGCDVFHSAAGETYHKFRLRVSDGVLLFRGNAPEEWLESQEQSLLQAAARRDRRQAAEAKYFTRKPNGHAVGVRVTQGARQEWIIERTGEPDANDLKPFFNSLRSMQAAGGLP